MHSLFGSALWSRRSFTTAKDPLLCTAKCRGVAPGKWQGHKKFQSEDQHSFTASDLLRWYIIENDSSMTEVYPVLWHKIKLNSRIHDSNCYHHLNVPLVDHISQIHELAYTSQGPTIRKYFSSRQRYPPFHSGKRKYSQSHSNQHKRNWQSHIISTATILQHDSFVLVFLNENWTEGLVNYSLDSGQNLK